MAKAEDLRRIALALEGTTEAPHFDRTAFKVARIYVTLAADGQTANLKFAPDEQELKCLTAPDAFAPVPNAWVSRDGRRRRWPRSPLPNLRMRSRSRGGTRCRNGQLEGGAPDNGTASRHAAYRVGTGFSPR